MISRANLLTGVLVCSATVVGYAAVRDLVDSQTSSSFTIELSDDEWSKLAPVDSNEDIYVVAFMDYQCEFCAEAYNNLEALSRHSNITVVYKHLPLVEIHEHAYQAAMAVECAAVQSVRGAMQRELFRRQEYIGRSPWSVVAKRARVADVKEFERCLKYRDLNDSVERDIELAGELGVGATPTIFVDGTGYIGVNSSWQTELKGVLEAR